MAPTESAAMPGRKLIDRRMLRGVRSSARKILKRLGTGAASPDVDVKQTRYPGVELVWWKPREGLNFGDVLSEVVVTKILADHGHTLSSQTAMPARLLGIGSILHLARDGDVVWGSGVNGKIPSEKHVYRGLDVRAVRGPLTQHFLQKKGISVPAVFGDPAILLPILFPELRPDPSYDHLVVPNLHDTAILQHSGVRHVSPTLGWNVCVREILKAKLVIASSLHGIIVAEAFGIPARYVRLSERESPFKYEDYALGSGRSRLEAAGSIEEAREMGGMEPPQLERERLLSQFPLDLWELD